MGSECLDEEFGVWHARAHFVRVVGRRQYVQHSCNDEGLMLDLVQDVEAGVCIQGVGVLEVVA